MKGLVMIHKELSKSLQKTGAVWVPVSHRHVSSLEQSRTAALISVEREKENLVPVWLLGRCWSGGLGWHKARASTC